MLDDDDGGNMPGALKLEQGKVYRAVVRVDVPRLVVSRSAVQSRFAELGFTDAIAWLDACDLPSDWPAGQRPTELPAGWPAFVQARWAQPSTTLEQPDAVLATWAYVPAAGAPPVTAGAGSDDNLGGALMLAGKLFLLSLAGKVVREVIDEVF